MYLFSQWRNKFILAFASFLLVSCANTKISQSWVEPDNKKSYNDLLIIGIAESEQNRRAYESYFIEALGAQNIEAIASYKLIKSNEKIDRDTVTNAIKGLGIDGVIITHMVAVEEETVYRPGAGSGGYGYGGYGYGGMGYGGSTHVSYYEEGALVIDIIDWQEKELSFRGTATGTLDKSEKTPEESQADIDDLVTNILAKFPPGQGNPE